jgi:putative ABC transport system permease protein
VLGTVASAVSLVPFSVAVSGSPVPQGSWWIYAGVVGFGVLITFAATLLPTWYALRTKPVEAAAVLT